MAFDIKMYCFLSSPGFAVGLVVRGADVGAHGVVAALANHGRVADVHGLVEWLRKEG